MNLLTLLGHEHHQTFGVQYFLFLCYLKNKALFRKMNDPGYLSLFPAPTLSHLSQNHPPSAGTTGRLETPWRRLKEAKGFLGSHTFSVSKLTFPLDEGQQAASASPQTLLLLNFVERPAVPHFFAAALIVRASCLHYLWRERSPLPLGKTRGSVKNQPPSTPEPHRASGA